MTTGMGPGMGMFAPLLQLQQTAGNQAVLGSVGGGLFSQPVTQESVEAPLAMSVEEPLAMSETRSYRDKTLDEIRKQKRQEKLDAKRKYRIGMHGYKKSEQQRLSNAYGIQVSGTTHESEHTIGFEPLNQTSGNTRGVGQQARELENKAPAYQEMKELHREHIGTGTQKARDESGFNSEEYRNSQRSLIEKGDVSSAVQLNQLGYAFDPAKSKLTTTQEGLAATDSYDTMVENMDSVTYASGPGETTVGVDAQQKAEMYLARRATISGKFPTILEENAARMKFGLPPLTGN
ncbi:hypothetical protein [Cohnella boryungensis]|uniref:Uncharacterized protein n=1 Tax=Cohnella boryungensis TaxID=768479 RepID=A0ABV8SAA8_9BACL